MTHRHASGNATDLLHQVWTICASHPASAPEPAKPNQRHPVGRDSCGAIQYLAKRGIASCLDETMDASRAHIVRPSLGGGCGGPANDVIHHLWQRQSAHTHAQ